MRTIPPGVATGARGFTCMQLDLDTMRLTVTEGLSEEALWGAVYAKGVATPLLLHQPVERVRVRVWCWTGGALSTHPEFRLAGCAPDV